MSSWKSWRIPRITVANQWWHYIEINEWEREEDTCDQGLSQARENRRVGVPLQQNFYLVVSFINFLHTQTWSRKWREIWTIEPDEANLKQNQDSSHLTVNRSIGRKFSGRKTCRGRNFTHEETESQIELTELISCHFESLAQSHELQKKKSEISIQDSSVSWLILWVFFVLPFHLWLCSQWQINLRFFGVYLSLFWKVF